MDQETLFRYFKCETSPLEEKQILDWVEADPKNRDEFEKASVLFAGIAVYSEHEALHASQRKARRTNIRTVVLNVTRVAAVILIGVGMFFLGRSHGDSDYSGQMNSIHVPDGQQMELTLADGSLIRMNSGATLSYPVVFSKKSREVSLVGEAYFQVEHNEDWPFIVRTFASDVSVLGTEFNVIAEESENLFAASLVNGRVKVSNRLNPGQEVILEPSEKVVMKDGFLDKSRMDGEKELSWTRGIIYLEPVPFDQLMKTFEKRFDVRIVIEREEMPQLQVISGKIRVSDGIESALTLLQDVSTGFEYVRRPDNTIIIR